MPDSPKLFINKIPVEICSSVQTGLPFVATLYMELILKSILATAQTMFPVTICHFIIMANHIHLLLVVKDPADVPKFMNYFKTESAHALNRLMGTTGQSFWIDGYDSPSILSADKFLERMLYLYLNPVEASIVPESSLYKGISTYNALERDQVTEKYKRIPRSIFKELPLGRLSKSFKASLAQSFLDIMGIDYELKVEPWAWLGCFEESMNWDVEKVRKDFLTTLKNEERNIARQKDRFLGNAILESRDIRHPYRSKREGKKMICLTSCSEQRSKMIAVFKELTRLARRAYQLRKLGDYRAVPPPGFFLPGGALLANIALPYSFLF
jgi:REP element-mobilizing transposase RayT